MKARFRCLTIIFLCISISVNAQKKFVDSSINKSTITTESHAIGGATDQLNKGIDNVFSGNIFKKKNKHSKEAGSSDTSSATSRVEKGKTEILVDNATYSSLSSLSDNLKSNQQVTDVEKTFSNGAGCLKISHNCTADELLDDLVKKSGDKFEVIEVNPGKIRLKMK